MKSSSLKSNSKQRTSRSAKVVNTKPIRMAGTTLSNLYTRKRGPLDHIYVNPTVTREGQRSLAVKLHQEIDSENALSGAFQKRPQPARGKDKTEDNAKIFNDFCVAFIDASKGTKEKVTDVIAQAQERLVQLDEIKHHLNEIERQTYRFEMNLPNPYEEEKPAIENEELSD